MRLPVICPHPTPVALLAEGVDRNYVIVYRNNADKVALLAEGVDRNMTEKNEQLYGSESPSSRRAWIEI